MTIDYIIIYTWAMELKVESIGEARISWQMSLPQKLRARESPSNKRGTTEQLMDMNGNKSPASRQSVL